MDRIFDDAIESIKIYEQELSKAQEKTEDFFDRYADTSAKFWQYENSRKVQSMVDRFVPNALKSSPKQFGNTFNIREGLKFSQGIHAGIQEGKLYDNDGSLSKIEDELHKAIEKEIDNFIEAIKTGYEGAGLGFGDSEALIKIIQKIQHGELDKYMQGSGHFIPTYIKQLAGRYGDEGLKVSDKFAYFPEEKMSFDAIRSRGFDAYSKKAADELGLVNGFDKHGNGLTGTDLAKFYAFKEQAEKIGNLRTTENRIIKVKTEEEKELERQQEELEKQQRIEEEITRKEAEKTRKLEESKAKSESLGHKTEKFEFKWGQYIRNADNNRLQLKMNEKPSDEERAGLKANGFKWAPSENAWQRQWTDNGEMAVHSIGIVLDKYKDLASIEQTWNEKLKQTEQQAKLDKALDGLNGLAGGYIEAAKSANTLSQAQYQLKDKTTQAVEALKEEKKIDSSSNNDVFRQINEKMKTQFGKGEDLELIFDGPFRRTEEQIAMLKRDFERIFEQVSTDYMGKNRDETVFDIENIMYKLSNAGSSSQNNGKGTFDAKSIKFNELKDVKFNTPNIINETEQELKAVEQQAQSTTKAVKQLTEAELEAEMRAAFQAASTLKPEKTEEIKAETKAVNEEAAAVESLGNKFKRLNADSFGITTIAERLNIGLSDISDFNRIIGNARNGKGLTQKNYDNASELVNSLREQIQNRINTNSESVINSLAINGNTREGIEQLLKTEGFKLDGLVLQPEVKVEPKIELSEDNNKSNIDKLAKIYFDRQKLMFEEYSKDETYKIDGEYSKYKKFFETNGFDDILRQAINFNNINTRMGNVGTLKSLDKSTIEKIETDFTKLVNDYFKPAKDLEINEDRYIGDEETKAIIEQYDKWRKLKEIKKKTLEEKEEYDKLRKLFENKKEYKSNKISKDERIKEIKDELAQIEMIEFENGRYAYTERKKRLEEELAKLEKSISNQSTKIKTQKESRLTDGLEIGKVKLKSTVNNIEQIPKGVESSTESVKQSVEQVPQNVQDVADNVKSTVENTSKAVEETVKNTVEYINNTINGFTLIGGIADELKKQFALTPVGRPYTKGDGFTMQDPAEKSLPALRPESGLVEYEKELEVIDAEYREIKDDVDQVQRARDMLHKRGEFAQESEELDANTKAWKKYVEEQEKAKETRENWRGNFYYDDGIAAPQGMVAELFNNNNEEAPVENNKAHAKSVKDTKDAYNQLKNTVSDVMNNIKQAIANVIKVVRTLNDIFNKTVIAIVGAFQKAVSLIQRVLQLFGSLSDRVRQNTNSVNILKGSFTELKSAVDLVVGAFNKLTNNQFLQKGKELLSSIQSLNMIIGTELTQSTIEWATNLENTFGLSAAELITNLKQVEAVLYGLGMSSKDVFNAGRNLETVGLQISSLTGYDYETVMRKLDSGLKGMTQSVDDLGISVREPQMDAFLKKIKAQGGEYANIGTSFSSLTEQQRVYVRYAAIMDQITSKNAYSLENYAKSLDTITGRMSILKSQVNALKSAIGVLALQILNKIIMPLTYIVYMAQMAIKKIAQLLKIDLSLDAGMNGGDTSEIDDTTDALDEMNEAAKEAKGSLDSLDHVSTMSNSGKNDDKFDYSKLIDLTSNYSDMLADMNKMNDDYIERCRQKLLEMLAWMKQKITDWVQEWTGRLIDWDVIKSNLSQVWENIKWTFKHIQSIARTTFGIISGLLYSVFDDLDATTLLAKFTKAIRRLTLLIDIILKRVAPKIQAFYDKYLSKYVIKFGDFLETKIDDIIKKLNSLIVRWTNPNNKGAIDDWFENIGKRFESIAKTISDVFTVIKTVFTGGSLDDKIKMEDSSDNMWNMYQAAVSLHQILYDVLDIIKDIAVHIVDFNGDGSFTFDDIRLAIETIKEKLDEVRKWLDENKESITNILSAVWDTIVKIGEVKFTIIKDLVKFIVDNEDTVVRVLNAIGELVKLAAEHPVIAFGVAVGGQLLGTGLKTLITATMWKLILGIGSKGTIATACSGIGTAITGAINKIKWGSVINELDGLVASEVAATSDFGLTGAAATATGVGIAGATIAAVVAELAVGLPQVKSLWNDAWIDMTGGLAEATDEAGNKVKITTKHAQQWAYDLRSALEQVYGKKIPTDEYERALNLMIEDLRRTGDYTEKELDTIKQNIEKQYKEIGNIDWLDDFAYKTENSERIISGLVDELNNKTTELKNTTATNATSTANSVVSMTNRIVSACNSSIAGVRNLINTINSLNSMSVHTITTQTSGWASDKGKVSVGSIKGFARANGGTVSSGSLFMANENGQSELVGNFGGYTGVANQDMIITAMKGAIGNSVYDAIIRAGGNSGTGTVNNFEICKSGMFVGDESAVRKLANMINNTNVSNKNNIANVGFSM